MLVKPIVKPTGRRPKLTHDIVAHVANKVATSKIVDMKHITTSVEKKFQVNISRSSVYGCLRKHNLTHKRTHFRTKRTDVVKQRVFESTIRETNINSIVSLDEASFDTHMTSTYGWSKRGEKCIMYPRHSRRARKRYSLLMAISSDKVITFKLTLGSFNKVKFISFMTDLLLPAMDAEPNLTHCASACSE